VEMAGERGGGRITQAGSIVWDVKSLEQAPETSKELWTLGQDSGPLWPSVSSSVK
jgi:hypothetical protein